MCENEMTIGWDVANGQDRMVWSIYNPRTGQYEEHAEWPEDMTPYQVEGVDGEKVIRVKFKLDGLVSPYDVVGTNKLENSCGKEQNGEAD